MLPYLSITLAHIGIFDDAPENFWCATKKKKWQKKNMLKMECKYKTYKVILQLDDCRTDCCFTAVQFNQRLLLGEPEMNASNM